jgi:hypothetical protein
VLFIERTAVEVRRVGTRHKSLVQISSERMVCGSGKEWENGGRRRRRRRRRRKEEHGIHRITETSEVAEVRRSHIVQRNIEEAHYHPE